MEGNVRFKINWASLSLFEGSFHVQAPGGGGLIFGGAISQRVFCVTILGGLYMEGLIFGIFTVLSNLPYLIIIVSSLYSLTITGYSILVLKCGL